MDVSNTKLNQPVTSLGIKPVAGPGILAISAYITSLANIQQQLKSVNI